MRQYSTRLVILTLLSCLTVSSPLFAVLNEVGAAVTSDFTWSPKFVIVGSRINFTASPTGGSPPYNFSWNFADGSTNATGNPVSHTYQANGIYNVTLAVKDSTSSTTMASHSVTVQAWPIIRDGWVVYWNVTSDDGINIWNVTYNGNLVVRDARLPGIQVTYIDRLCGPFYDEPTTTYQDDIVAGQMSYHNSSDPSNPWWEILANYNVPGYSYQQFWRFFPDGRWDAGLNMSTGCPFDHVYQPHWRMDLSVVDDQNNFMSQFTRSGEWQDLIWEGQFADSGSRDPAHNNTVWSFGGHGKSYYLAPSVTQAASDLPLTPSSIILLRNHPSEVESNHVAPYETPEQWSNGELAFRRNIVFWFLSEIADHGGAGPANQAVLSFYPVGF